MKKFLVLLSLVSFAAFAEPSFQQLESLIDKQQYAAAEQGLEEVIKNHPTSAKAFYAMAQAQAGLGHLDKAQFALNKAKGLDPELKFASSSQVSSLEEAISPQTKKIEPIEETHYFRNLILLALLGGIGYFVYTNWATRRKAVPASNSPDEKTEPVSNVSPITPLTPAPAAINPAITIPTNAAIASSMTASVTSPSNITSLNQNTPVPHVVNNYYGSPTAPSVNNSGTDLLTGMVLGGLAGAALSNNNYRDHDTVIIERAPAAPVAPRRDSSWDEDTAPPAPSRRDTSWDDDSSKSSSSRDSSWDSGSSSSDSSSWDSGSSSSGSSDW